MGNCKQQRVKKTDLGIFNPFSQEIIEVEMVLSNVKGKHFKIVR